jgi:hypothetical protein
VGNARLQKNQPVAAEEQRLYDHLLDLVQVETPSQLIERIRLLFIEGLSYPDEPILADLDQLVLAKDADQEFRFILNRCIHILTNRWQGRPQYQTAIPTLVDLLESSPTRPANEYARARSVKRLRELVKDFAETEQSAALRRLAHVVGQSAEATQTQPLGNLIRRYPYLYHHCLVSEGSSEEHQRSIRGLQEQVQRQYEFDLSQYVTYQVRKSQLLRSSSEDTVGRTLYPVKNPTLLSESEFFMALRQFAGKVDGERTHRELAQRFMRNTPEHISFGGFKENLYRYLISAVDTEYGQRQFNSQLYVQLQNILPENDHQPLNEFLLMRTCSQLLNFLIVESVQQPKHFVFVDLISNIGPTLTTTLILKLILICRKIKPYLEKRFSILFSHYETYSRDCVEWLVAAMENLNIALCTNFGSVNLAFVNQL